MNKEWKSIQCEVEFCENKIKSRNLKICSTHYERLRVHGNMHITYPNAHKPCIVLDCERTSIAKGLCRLHYARVLRYGSTVSKSSTYGKGSIHGGKYRRIFVNGKQIFEHVYLAEKALGRKLPEKAVIHHMNENGFDNKTPFNLIICPSQAYHFLLHKRAKELEQYGKCITTEYSSTIIMRKIMEAAKTVRK